LLREVTNDAVDGLALGTPFFRNVTVTLNFLEDEIEIFSKTVNSPIAYREVFPETDMTI
jgi:hypothetical protein